jgi:dienelactone hydrolase
MSAAVLAISPIDSVSEHALQVGVPGCTDDVAVQAARDAIVFPSRNREIRAHLYRPLGPPNGKAVVLLHGGTGFEMNSILFDAHAIQLASRGYWVILPAYFDSGAPDRSRQVVTARAWRRVALDAAREVANRSGVAIDQVTLWGYSRGAGVALGAAAAPDSSVRLVVLVAGGGRLEAGPTLSGLSALVLHARTDEAVPVRSSRAMAADLASRGARVAVRELPFDGHQYDLSTWCAVMSATRTFTAENTPAPAPSERGSS